MIVDENVGRTSKLWLEFERALGGQYSDFLWLSDSHPGIPDVEIIDKLLSPGSVLLTGDCVLHQRAIDAGFRSYTLNEQGQLTRRRLPQVQVRKPLPASVHKQLEPSYLPHETPRKLEAHATSDITEIRKRLKSQLTEKDFKRLRTARRRIRSHFGSAEAIAQVSITIGSVSTRKGVLAGSVFRFAGNSGVKGLRGSETYCLCANADGDDLCPFVVALRHLLLLRFEHVRTEAFIIPPATFDLASGLTQQQDVQPGVRSTSLEAALRLADGVAQLSIQPCVKGPFFDELQRKLKSLASLKSNEIKSLDYAALIDQVAADPDIASSE